MNTVQPIRDKEKIEQMKQFLKAQNPRDYILFALGIYLGRRITDILKLKVKDLRGKDTFIINENKTGKSIRFKIHPELKSALDEYLANKDDEAYIIGSREYATQITVKQRLIDPKTGKKRSNSVKIKNIAPNSPISREMAWNILNKAAKKVGLEEIGTHSCRKTFGYFLYTATNNIALVQRLLNHSSPEVTLAYIGITQMEMDDAVCNLPY
jgi:integrase